MEPLNPLPQLEGGIADELFGSSISFSSDGNVLAVGGLAGWDVYEGGDDITTWTPRTTVNDTVTPEDVDGSLVVLNNDGSSVFVADDGGTRIQNFRWNGTDWLPWGNVVTNFTLNEKVLSLVASGDGMTKAVGGYGSIQVFHFIAGPNRHFPRGQALSGNEALGSKLALDETGERLVASSSATGEVSAFEWDYQTNTWNLMGDPLPAVSGSPIDSVVMSSAGNVVAVGSGGSVYVYTYVNGVWSMIGNPIAGSDSSFGKAMTMAGDASLIVIGANENDDFLVDAGQVSFYGFSGGDWVERYDTTYGAAEGDRWGTSVAISRDGHIIAIGADQRDKSPLTGYVGIFIREL